MFPLSYTQSCSRRVHFHEPESSLNGSASKRSPEHCQASSDCPCGFSLASVSRAADIQIKTAKKLKPNPQIKPSPKSTTDLSERVSLTSSSERGFFPTALGQVLSSDSYHHGTLGVSRYQHCICQLQAALSSSSVRGSGIDLSALDHAIAVAIGIVIAKTLITRSAVVLGWDVCRTKLPPKKTKKKTNTQNGLKTRKKIQKGVRTFLSPSGRLKIFNRHFSKSFSPPKIFTNKKVLFHCEALQGWPR